MASHTTPLPLDQLPAFNQVYNISAPHIAATQLDEAHGVGLRITSVPSDPEALLLSVPRDLLLNTTTVENASKSDANLAAALAATPELANTTRGKVMLFLMVRMLENRRDVWSEYIRFLPSFVPVPTSWPEPERHLLTGTSLETPLSQKLARLDHEFNLFRTSTLEIPFFQHAEEKLTINDWVRADSWFRSRHLDLPEPAGLSMVPFLDFANHNTPATARYDVDKDGNAVLVLNEGVEVKEGLEITIDYSGGDKDPAEMLFSYGFIPEDVGNAGTVRLPLDCQEDDPLAMAKGKVFDGARVVTFFEDDEKLWKSDWVWLTILNDEDGLLFRVVETNSGERSLEVSFNGHILTSFSSEAFVQPYLMTHPLWPVFQLRAVVTLSQLVEYQLGELLLSAPIVDQIQKMGLARESTISICSKLRDMEEQLLIKALEKLDTEKTSLLKDPTVLQYLAKMQAGEEPTLIDENGDPDLS